MVSHQVLNVVSTSNAPNSVSKSWPQAQRPCNRYFYFSDGRIRVWPVRQFQLVWIKLYNALFFQLQKINNSDTIRLSISKLKTKRLCTYCALYHLIILLDITISDSRIDQTLTRMPLVTSIFFQFSRCQAAAAVFFKLASLVKYTEESCNITLHFRTSRFIDIL